MLRVVIVVALAVLMSGAPGHASSLRSGDILALAADGVILRIDPVTGSDSVVAAGGRLADTDGITVSPQGEIYVIQSGDTIVRVLPSTGEQVVLASGRAPGFVRHHPRPRWGSVSAVVRSLLFDLHIEQYRPGRSAHGRPGPGHPGLPRERAPQEDHRVGQRRGDVLLEGRRPAGSEPGAGSPAAPEMGASPPV